MNIQNPSGFSKDLGQVISNLYDLFEQVREEEYVPNDLSRIDAAPSEKWKCLFQVSGQFKRPADFLQTLLDMLRVMYEPNAPGTFFLNANPDFIFDEIRSEPFQLGYVTAVSELGEAIAEFYGRVLTPKLREHGYVAESAFATYAFVTLGQRKGCMDRVREVMQFLDAGFSVDEVKQIFANIIDGQSTSKSNRRYAGFAFDEALDTRMRLSLWLFLPGVH